MKCIQDNAKFIPNHLSFFCKGTKKELLISIQNFNVKPHLHLQFLKKI